MANFIENPFAQSMKIIKINFVLGGIPTPRRSRSNRTTATV
jgi:hypothetical protein